MAAMQVPGRSSVSFVSTVRPTHSQRNVAVAAAGMSLAVFALIAPFAKMPLQPHPGFLPLYQSALIVFDLVTSVLLFGQYRMLRNRAVLLLAAGYVFSALMAAAHALSFPGLFGPAGVIGDGSQTTAWLYFFWHAGFALFIMAYAGAARGSGASNGPSTARGVVESLACAAAGATACALLATRYRELLPSIMNGDLDAPAKLAVAMITWLIGIAALLLLSRRRPHTVLDLWLMVVLGVWIADTALAAVLNHGRFDVGWYAGRAYGLLANGFVLAVLLLESGSLYARLARSNRLLGEALTETRRLNDDLQAFAGSLAHDLQQPLITISAFAQVMRQGKLEEREIAHLEKISGAADTARKMIKALLEFARLGESRLETGPVDLNETVRQARSAVTTTAQGSEIDWNIDTLPAVQGDRALLLLAFMNLLSNAVKYTRTQARPMIAVRARVDASGAHVISVRDNGVGFDMSQAQRLFVPFERLHSTREFEGTGMGLANVRRIVEKHGGTISAESHPGEGAEFRLVLPSAAETPVAAGIPKPVACPG
jgi:signal transduction histidine kinase